MSLAPYEYRPLTPDTMDSPSPKYSSAHSRHTSRSSVRSSSSSNYTRATTLSPSPQPRTKQYGPTLLPKVRSRDQGLEPEIRAEKSHRGALSSNCNPPERAPLQRPVYQRSTTSPPECSSLSYPVSTTYAVESCEYDTYNPPITYVTSARSASGHGRSSSTPAVDINSIRRFVNPTYRSTPVYTTRSSPRYAPAVLPGLQDFVSPEYSIPVPIPERELTPELLSYYGPTTSVMNYLKQPDPAWHLVANKITGIGIHTHCWFDVRNLRVWEDFNINTITKIPGFASSLCSYDNDNAPSGILNIPVNAAALPEPQINSSALRPVDERALQHTYTKFYAAKINAAIKTCQGKERHITMSPEYSSENGPYFLSSYANDIKQTLGTRARVVGLVKSYEVWNTGMRMRQDNPYLVTQYMAHLAHLQRMMREHNCRYGFIITEIELVCVRLGTEERIPYFGLLELSKPITVGKAGRGLSPCLALWYLHMLTGDKPLAGQLGWKVEVGPPTAMSRRKVLEEGRDAWMPKLTKSDERNARTRRGWILPSDDLSRKEKQLASGRARR